VTACTSGPAPQKLGINEADIIARSDFVTGLESVAEITLIPNENDISLIIIPSTYEPGIIDRFTITVYSANQVSLEEIPASAHWLQTELLRSSWTAENSGGCKNYPTWKTNPSFIIDKIATTMDIVVVISQPDNQTVLPIGFYVFDTKGKVRCKGAFALAPEVFANLSVNAAGGPYTIMACTFEPSMVGDFTLQAFSPQPLNLQPLR
jgi:hypothetical protein